MSNGDNKPPSFWELTEEDLQEWRRLPLTVLLLKALQADMDNHLKNCAEAAAVGSAVAGSESGRASMAERYLFGIARKREKPIEPEQPDTTFHDRATRLSTQVRHG